MRAMPIGSGSVTTPSTDFDEERKKERSMPKNKQEIHTTFRAALLVASKETTRPYLNGVLYDHTAKSLISTDGHRLLELKQTLPLDQDVLFDVETVKLIIAATKPSDKADRNTPVEVTATHVGPITYRSKDPKNFPPWRVFAAPTDDETFAVVGFDPVYMADLATIYKLLGCRYGVSLQTRGATGPMSIRSADYRVHYVLMPTRL